MSFRLFIYYCAAWGAATALAGWVLGRALEGNSPLFGAAFRGMCLGLSVAFGLVLVDALVVAAQRGALALGVRILLALLIGAGGGLIGGLVGQGCFQLSGSKWPWLLVFGWALTGFLIGAAPAAFDLLAAALRGEERRGVHRKLRNGLLGGALGGVAGGLVSLLGHGFWEGVVPDADARDLWSPGATGFVALGACIGLAVSLAQIILREAWIRVESGFRPGRQLLLTRPETVIGRAEWCDVGLFGDAGVEKQHARIVREGNRWLLIDLGSPSGTLHNGRRITEPTPIHSGDRIQVGNSVLSFGVRG